MPLTHDDKSRLNKIFSGLWGDRFAIKGSWGASTHGYHPTFIRRHGLLLKGTTELESVYVLFPADCEVIPEFGDPRGHCNVMPKVSGELIHVYQSDEGVWWDALRAEIPKMEAELQSHQNAKNAEYNQRHQSIVDERARKLSLATQAFIE